MWGCPWLPSSHIPHLRPRPSSSSPPCDQRGSGSLLRAAGSHAHLEQEVQKPDGGFRRADIVAIHHSGEQLALDVQCTGCSDYQVSSTAHLTSQDTAKAGRYGVAPGATLPSGVYLLPLMHLSGIPCMGLHATLLLHRLVHLQASATAPPTSSSWGAPLARTQLSATAALIHAMTHALPTGACTVPSGTCSREWGSSAARHFADGHCPQSSQRLCVCVCFFLPCSQNQGCSSAHFFQQHPRPEYRPKTKSQNQEDEQTMENKDNKCMNKS